MSSTLETRLAEALGALPGPSELAEARALAAALDAIPSPRSRRRQWPRVLALAAALVVLLGVGAVALAAMGTIHVGVGHERDPPRAEQLVLPAGMAGIAVVAAGKLWLTTRDGTRIEGLAATAAELSPHALYVAVGTPSSLLVMSPSGRRAWSRPTRGRVEAIAWSPDALRIAYVVRAGGGWQLRAIEGDGDHDRLIDASVRPVQPSWRGDALAVAYVGGGGRPLVYDLGRDSHRAVGDGCVAADTRVVAFAPAGRVLAFAGAHSVGVGGAAGCVRYPVVTALTGLAWTSRTGFATTERVLVDADPSLRTFTVAGRKLVVGGSGSATAPMRAIAAQGRRLVLVAGSRVLLADAPGRTSRPLRLRRTLLEGVGVGRVAISVR